MPLETSSGTSSFSGCLYCCGGLLLVTSLLLCEVLFFSLLILSSFREDDFNANVQHDVRLGISRAN